MRKKVKLIICLITLFILSAVSVMLFYNRPHRNILFTLKFHSNQYPRIENVMRFVVQKDGTLVSYLGTGYSLSIGGIPTVIMMPFLSNRARQNLSDETFLSIREHLDLITSVAPYSPMSAMSMARITLVYNNNIYTQRMIEVHHLTADIITVSTLMGHMRGE